MALIPAEDPAGVPGIALLLRASGLCKRYGSFPAVQDLDLNLRRGEIYGLLGPNGSGKSTTIRMLTGILAPTSGSINIAGHDLTKEPEKAKAAIGYVPDEPLLYEKLSAVEFLEFIAELYDVPRSVRSPRIQSLLNTLDLSHKSADLIQSYSRGMKQKISIAAALLPEPQILIMDEPVTGLDPISARILKGILRRMARNGKAVIMSTHLLEIAEHLCDRIGILAEGTLMAEGTMEELSSMSRQADFSGASHENATLEDIFIQLAAGEEHKELIQSLEDESPQGDAATPAREFD